MPLGNTEPIGKRVQTVKKSNAAQIALGKVCIVDTALTPDGWKQATGIGDNGPFRIAVDKLYASTDASFSGSLPGTMVCVKAGAGGLTPGAMVKTDASGDVVAATLGTDAHHKIVGQYIRKDGEYDQTDAAQNDPVWILQMF